MPLNISESPLGKEPDMLAGSKLLDNLSGKTTKVAEGVMNMIEKLPPEQLALCAAGVIGILACLDLDKPKKEGEEKKAESQKEAKTDTPKQSEPVKEALSSLKKEIEVPNKDKIEDEYKKRQAINIESGSRILKYSPDPDVIEKLLKIKKNEPLVTVEGGDKLKESVAWAFQRAREIAKGMGYSIIINSGYRPPERQKELYDAAKPEDRGRLVAAPGGSWHQSGGTGDFSLVKIGSNESLTQVSSKMDKPTKYTDILEYCMNRAGFVRYSQEGWHFEIRSKEWVGIMQKKGFIKQNVALADYIYKKDRMGKFSSPSENMA